jgi:hypothetical protein
VDIITALALALLFDVLLGETTKAGDTVSIDSSNPLQRATEVDRRPPGKPKAHQKRERFGYLPLMGETERGLKKPACCSLSLAVGASVCKSLSRLLECQGKSFGETRV